MPLKPEQINLISFIDQKVKDILSSGGNEISVMISLLDEMPRVKTIIDSADKLDFGQIASIFRHKMRPNKRNLH